MNRFISDIVSLIYNNTTTLLVNGSGMVLFPPSKLIRPLGGTLRLAFLPRTTKRLKRYEAFDTHLDKDALAEARSWFAKFDATQLPHGNTTYARSSGPGGQHVNK